VMIQVKIFWVVMPCNVAVDMDISEVHATSIFRMKLMNRCFT